MGSLEIRRSSANVNRLGQFRMPELDNGSAKAWQAHANAAKEAAAAARVAGMAETEGVARRGQIVAKTMGNLAGLALDLVNRENERIATNAILASETERNAYMYGDGTAENPGQFNVEFDAEGAQRWLDSLKAENKRRTEKHTKDLNSAQRRIYDERMAKKEVEWQLRIGSHAAKKSFEYQVRSAEADVKSALGEACSAFADPNSRDAKIADYYGTVEKEFKVRGLPESQRTMFFRKATETLLLEMPKRTFGKWEAETAASDDPDAVRGGWDKNRELLAQTDGKAPMNPLIRKYLGSDAVADDMAALIKARFEESADKAVSRAKNLRLAHVKEASRSFEDQIAAKRADLLDPEKVDSVVFDFADFRRQVEANAVLSPSAKADLLASYRSAMDYQDKYRADLERYYDLADKKKAKAAAALEEKRRRCGWFDENGRFYPASAFAKENHPYAVDKFDPTDKAFWSDTAKANAALEAARMNGMLTEGFYSTCRKTLRNFSDEDAKKELAALLPYYENLLPRADGSYGANPAKKADPKDATAVPRDFTGFYAKTRSARGTPRRPGASFVEDMTTPDKQTYSSKYTVVENALGGSLATHVDVPNPPTEEAIDWPTWNKCLDAAYEMRGMGFPTINAALQEIVAPSLKAGFTRSLKERISRDGINSIVEQYRRETAYYGAEKSDGSRTPGTLGQAVSEFAAKSGKIGKKEEE